MRIVVGAGLLMSLLISGCAHNPAVEVVTKVETRQIEVPEALLTCMPEPEARRVWKSQKEVALYLIGVSEAGEDCRQKLDGVRRLISEQ
jgi:hypothetical protein